MPVHKIEPLGEEGKDTNAVVVWPSSDSGSKISIAFASLSGTRPTKEASIVAQLQESLDTRQLISGLPNDDPDGKADPNRDDLFWGDADGTPNPSGAWLISRGVEVVDAPWNVTAKKYQIQLRKTTQEARS